MKKRSRLRKRVRDWLRKRKVRKEERPIPSFGSNGSDHLQEQSQNPKEFYQDEKPTGE